MIFAAMTAAMLLFGAPWAVSAAGAGERPVLVELFTSQGCSSCPPADAMLSRLAQRDDVIALSYHVDYWDYLGWKDTLGSPRNTERQRGYAGEMRRRNVYTPQMVVDGHIDVVGSNVSGVERAIRRAAAEAGGRVRIALSQQDDMVTVRITGEKPGGDATIWLVRFDRVQEIEIRRGENTGRTIAYHNVVREYRSLGLWRGGVMEIALSRAALMAGGREGCAVIVQKKRFGPILGVANLDLRR